MAPIRKKLVIVGDGACGKTSLLHAFSKGTFSPEHDPTVFDNFVVEMMTKGKKVELALWDTAGQEDYDRIRPLSYMDSDVILICFDVARPNTLENAVMKWAGEVKYFCPGVPILLVATKTDLRHELKVSTVSAIAGGEAADRIGASHFVQCSAKEGEGVAEVFDKAVRAALHKDKKSMKLWCC
ncbi:hypothetical protein QR680_002729 [Steinernema hermaphroditum]|uniref:Uncharacterized protein n=1 Tax=Steinernema hermaphroditum TaxID=289476 RepID=A0AA39LIR0_9BILA|nr:hypothetical protein QR680_002729 [Steinernema hermaphroditum]